jgi:hypothetical protein
MYKFIRMLAILSNADVVCSSSEPAVVIAEPDRADSLATLAGRSFIRREEPIAGLPEPLRGQGDSGTAEE